MQILALNPGSETLRYKLMAIGNSGESVSKEGYFDHVKGPATAGAAEQAVAECVQLGLDAIGYRVVHGGDKFTAPIQITDEVLEGIRGLAPLAPLHVPTDLIVIEAASRIAPDVPGVAVFDTAFHRTLPQVARRYALPEDAGPVLWRHGFHGISHRYASAELLRLLGRGSAGSRLISIHLGGGASACAVRDGNSIDTSMGMTPLEGLVMSTRCGDLDPGVVLYLFRGGMSPAQVEDLLYRRSGLLGLSDRSNDLRVLEPAAAGGDRKAALALDIYAYRVRKYIGAYAAALGGLDAVVVSGALAENSANLRHRVLQGLEFLGIHLDGNRNRDAGPYAPSQLNADESPVAAWLVPADEEGQIARDVYSLLSAS